MMGCSGRLVEAFPNDDVMPVGDTNEVRKLSAVVSILAPRVLFLPEGWDSARAL